MRPFLQIARGLLAFASGFFALHAVATTYYVNQNNPNPTSPYTSWATAATNIEDAAGETSPGDTVLVTNGVYQYGIYDDVSGSNRVYITTNVTVQSLNGPALTMIEGYGASTTNEAQATRCVFLNPGAVLSGFTLTNGFAGMGGGVYGPCCASTNCLVTNCVIAANAAYNMGAGGCYGTFDNCVFSGNFVTDYGGAGGAYESTLINCLVVANTAAIGGGAAVNSTLVNCTVVSNTASSYSGGGCALQDCAVNNTIAYYNLYNGAEADVNNSDIISNCCASVVKNLQGVNNFTNAPLFSNIAAGNFQLSPYSPCINAGNNSFVTIGNDLAGNPRIVYGTVDVGAYESSYNTTNFHYVSLASTNPVSPYNGWSIAATNIQTAVDAGIRGDQVFVTNGLYNVGGRYFNGYGLPNRVVIDRAVTVQSVNGPGVTLISGNSPFGTSAIRCVVLTNGSALYGFTLTNGATLTDGDATYETSGGGLLCQSIAAVASNCVIMNCLAYNAGGGVIGGTLDNCTLIHNFAQYGGGAYGYGANYGISNILNNCNIASNSAVYLGGGADYSALNGCIISSNSAPSEIGGGAIYSSLTNCLLVANRANNGGAAYSSTLINCTITTNTAATGGGVYDCTLDNDILYYNTGGDYYPFTPQYPLYYCCTAVAPANGFADITNAPLFVNAAAGNFQLQSSSPCINSGNNLYVLTTNDLAGNPRIVGGTVDIGAYEYQTPTSVISYAWLEQYGLPTNGSVDFSDLDGTAFNVYQDWAAGLNPTNPASVLVMLTPTNTINTNGITATWKSVNGITYFLQRSTNLFAQPTFLTIQSSITGQTNKTSYADSSATNNFPYFYRVGVIAP